MLYLHQGLNYQDAPKLKNNNDIDDVQIDRLTFLPDKLNLLRGGSGNPVIIELISYNLHIINLLLFGDTTL